MFGGVGRKIEKAVRKKNAPALIKLADGKDIQVRLDAIAGLGKFKDGDGINYLVSQLRNVDAKIRAAAAAALAETGEKSAKQHVISQFTRETDEIVKAAMQAAIRKLQA